MFSLAAAFGVLAASSASATIVVPTQQPTIQDAINAALPGELITVLPGTYIEGAINVTTSVVLQGPNTGVVPSQTRGPEARVVGGFVITSDNVTIEGFEIVEYVPVGISRNAISGPQALDGISVSSNWFHSPLPASFITSVELGDPTGVARSNDLRIVGNIVDGQLPASCQGVSLYVANNAKVVGNRIVLLTTPSGSGDFGLPAIVLEGAHGALIAKNDLDCGQTNSNISSVAYCVGIQAIYDSCEDVKISDNRMVNCIEGVQSTAFHFAVRNLSITRNDIDATMFGIGVQMSTNGTTNTISHESVDIDNNHIASGIGCVRVVVVGLPGTSATVADLEMHGNCFVAQAGAINVFGVGVNAAVTIPTNGGVLDATKNYWDAADGPSTVGPGSGVRVTTRVDFSKWRETCHH